MNKHDSFLVDSTWPQRLNNIRQDFGRFNFNIINSTFFCFDSHSQEYWNDEYENFMEKIKLNGEVLKIVDYFDGKFILFNDKYIWW